MILLWLTKIVILLLVVVGGYLFYRFVEVDIKVQYKKKDNG